MIDWKFKDGAKPQGHSYGFWDDINEGYITPIELLADPQQLKSLEDALVIVQSFKQALNKAGLIEEA